MNHAISYLEVYLETLENNEPINRREGKIEQADLEAESIRDIRRAIYQLNHPSEREATLEDLLVSAHAIAKREGKDTDWLNFSKRLTSFGIGSITPRTFLTGPHTGVVEDKLDTIRDQMKNARIEELEAILLALKKSPALWHPDRSGQPQFEGKPIGMRLIHIVLPD